MEIHHKKKNELKKTQNLVQKGKCFGWKPFRRTAGLPDFLIQNTKMRIMY
jgi:hypothetical protein